MDEEEEQVPRAIRLRRARGGRWFVDRRLRTTSTTMEAPHVFSSRRRLHEGDSDDDRQSDGEQSWRLSERRKFDEDDSPAVGPEGPDEQDRVLLDDFDPRFLRHAITLLHEQDQQSLSTDNSLTVTGPDGRLQTIIPYRLGLQPPMIRRDTQLGQRPDADEEDANSCKDAAAAAKDIIQWRYASTCYAGSRQHVVEFDTVVPPADATPTCPAAYQWYQRCQSQSQSCPRR